MLHPARGVWIETTIRHNRARGSHKLHPARGVWIETEQLSKDMVTLMLHPARGVWIETPHRVLCAEVVGVAPRKGCVD